MKEQQERLIDKKFPKSLIKKRKGNNNRTFDYVEGNVIIKRLNEVFNHDWSFAVVDRVIDMDNSQILILGEIRVPQWRLSNLDSVSTHEDIATEESPFSMSKSTHGSESEESYEILKQQWGGAPIQRYKTTKLPVDLGNDMKIATTDAMKKCATLFGIALHLYNQDEVIRTYDLSAEEAKDLNLSEEEKSAIKGKAAPAVASETAGKPSTKGQQQSVSKVLDKKGVESITLLAFLGIKSFDEMSYDDAAGVLTGKHEFWSIK